MTISGGSRGVINHYRCQTGHNRAQHRQRSAGRGGQHDADTAALQLSKATRQNQCGEQCLGVADVPAGGAIDERGFCRVFAD